MTEMSSASVQNEILSVINEFGLGNNVKSYPPSVGKKDLFKVFYHRNIRELLTYEGKDKRILIYKAPCDYAADIMLRFPANSYIYLHSSYREMERFQRDYRSTFDVKNTIIFSTGENLPLLKPFDIILAFDNDFESNRDISHSLSSVMKKGAVLYSFHEGEGNFSEVDAMVAGLRPKSETRGRKPFKTDAFSVDEFFKRERSDEWVNRLAFPELRFFLYFLFKYVSDNGYSVHDHVEYFSDRICVLFSSGKGFAFNAHYVLDVFRAE